MVRLSVQIGVYMKKYLTHIIRTTDKWTSFFMNQQIKEVDSRSYGAVKTDIYEARPTIFYATSAVCSYYSNESVWFQNPKLYQAIENALGFIESAQREDGSFDYPSCNFMSAPDTAFCFDRMIAAYRIILKYDTMNQAVTIKDQYQRILYRALDAICNGGFHTPNHRWAICASLMQGVNLLAGKPEADKYLDRVKQYLAEGIDGDEDGQYAERSTGNYNAVVNHALFTIFEESGDESYLEYIERNLHMMLTFFDPDDTIFTQNSTRQDHGKADFPDQYFYQYLSMSAHKFNPEFDAAAHKIIEDNMMRGADAPDCLFLLMQHPELYDYEFKGNGFLDTYRKYYKETGVLRVKTPKYGYTVLKDKSAFLFIKFKETPIYIKIGESYCAIRNFIPQAIDITEQECILSATAKGWYYLPFKEDQGTKDWWKMDHKKRDLLESSEVTITMKIKELERGLEITVKAEGLDRLPLRVEICIPSGCRLENEHFCLESEKGSGMILRDGYLNITHHQNHIQVGPGFGTHEFKGHYSGEEVNSYGYTVFLNEYTPYEKTFSIQVVD